MNKIGAFISEWWREILGVLFIVSVVALIVAAFVWEFKRPRLIEGLVTNKMFFPSYSTCSEKGCDYTSAKWIVTIQNGDEFDSWYVSENYYDDVHIGDWVRK